MILPNYRDGSIVNLMASILRSYGLETPYRPLKLLPPAELAESRNVVLLVLDGLGYEYLRKYGRKSFLHGKSRGKITSVFPSTTAAACTTFNTGLAPAQHATTGWFMYLKELGTIAVTIPFTPRYARTERSASFIRLKIRPKGIFAHKPVFEKLPVPSYMVAGKEIVNSVFSSIYARKAKQVGCRNIPDFFSKLKLVLAKPGRKFVYAYWPDIDSLIHDYGTKDARVKKRLMRLDEGFRSLYRSLGEDTTIIVTADHGLIDNRPSARVLLRDHPGLQRCLSMPLSGESRAAYCYVHPSRRSQFEKYVRTHLAGKCTLHRSGELVRKGYFGLFSPHEKLWDRIGDYVLIMEDNYLIKDFILGEKEKYNVGVHGGISREEMWVPLIVLAK
jgi:hypothetical protein